MADPAPHARDGDSLVDGVAYLSLYASGAREASQEPHYLGASSGATIARFIQSSIFFTADSVRPDADVHKRNPNPCSTDEQPESPLSVEALDTTTRFPEVNTAGLLLITFFDRIHTRWPLLDRDDYMSLFERRETPDALTMVQRSIFHLLFAITARFLSLTRKPSGVDSELHFAAATEHMDQILEQHSLATVQFILLLAVHGQRSPYGAGAWAQVRYAMSMCIEMGLHRSRPRAKSSTDVKDNELRCRAFWSCYSLDCSISKVLGRPFAIDDKDIDVEMPSASVDYWSLTHAGHYDEGSSHQSNVAPFVHIVKLDRIKSRVHKAVYRVDRDVSGDPHHRRGKIDRKMEALKTELDTWLSECPRTPKEPNKTTWMYDPENTYLDARDFYNVQYHKAILFLYTVLLPTLAPEDPRFITCTRSAAAVCTAYKRLNQNRTLTYTMVSLHSCFMAGLTLVYCSWRGRPALSYDSFEAIRDCSQSLTIFGEKWAGAVKYRDIFDALSGSLLRTMMNPGMPQQPENGNRPLQPIFEPQHMHTSPGQSSSGQHASTQMQHNTSDDPSRLTHLLSDAVKDAFMEVDEEAPGGWQGWRMWNEMTGDVPSTTVSGVEPRLDYGDGNSSASHWTQWSGQSAYDPGSMQSAPAGSNARGAQWDFPTWH